jgi:hypothetical protein
MSSPILIMNRNIIYRGGKLASINLWIDLSVYFTCIKMILKAAQACIFGGLLQSRILLWEKSSMTRFNSLEYFILFFYRDSIVVCLTVVYEYESILEILINVIFN